MIAFFTNIWEWIVSHAGIIAGILTPANLALLVGAVVSLLRQKRTIITNTNVAGDLTKALQKSDLNEAVRSNEKEISAVKALVGSISDQMSQAITKLNAVLDVQDNAYRESRALTEATRDTIHNLIASGKYAESESRVAIGKEVEVLKTRIAELLTAGEAAEAKVKKLTNTEKPRFEKEHRGARL